MIRFVFTLVLLVLVSQPQLAAAQTNVAASIAFAANITGDKSGADLGFRETLMSNIHFPGIVNIAYFISLEISADVSVGADSSEEGDLNGIAGAFLLDVGFPYFPPAAILMFFDAKASASLDVGVSPSFIEDIFEESGSATAGASLAVFTSITEVDGNTGATVASYDFDDLYFNFSASSVVTDTTGELHSITYTAPFPDKGNPDFTTAFTVVTSSVMGILNNKLPITPKNMAVILQISNYPYASPSNYLNVTVYGATISKSLASYSEGFSTVSAGSGPDAPYVYFTSGATVTGINTGFGAVADAMSALGDIINDITPTDYTFNAREVTLTFPAGSASIYYPVAVGFDPPSAFGGNGPWLDESGASQVASSVVFIIVSACLAVILTQ